VAEQGTEQQALDWLAKLVQNPLTGILGGASAFVSGITMLLDDASDFPELDRLHHWLPGILLLLSGAAGMGWGILSLLATQLKPSEEALRQLRLAMRQPPEALKKGAEKAAEVLKP